MLTIVLSAASTPKAELTSSADASSALFDDTLRLPFPVSCSGDNYFRHIVTAAVPPLVLSLWQVRPASACFTQS